MRRKSGPSKVPAEAVLKDIRRRTRKQHSAEEKIVINSWRRHQNTKRPHSSLGYRPPALEVISWRASPSGAASPATHAVAPRRVMH